MLSVYGLTTKRLKCIPVIKTLKFQNYWSKEKDSDKRFIVYIKLSLSLIEIIFMMINKDQICYWIPSSNFNLFAKLQIKFNRFEITVLEPWISVNNKELLFSLLSRKVNNFHLQIKKTTLSFLVILAVEVKVQEC